MSEARAPTGDRRRVPKLNPFVVGLCALMLVVFAYCFWINAQ